MALIPPVPGFNYVTDPSKAAWTRKYVRSALGNGDPTVVDDLFEAVTQLVHTRNLTNYHYKGMLNPATRIASDRAAAAVVLVNQFRHRIDVQGYPTFADRLCKGVITYMGGSGKRIDVSADSHHQ